MDTPNELSEFLTSEYQMPDLDDEDGVKKWICDSDDKATWCLRKLAIAEAEIARVQEVAAREVGRIEIWAAQASSSPLRKADFFRKQLEGYQRRELARDSTRKTISLPGGILRARESVTTEVEDEEAFIAWATASGLDHLLKQTARKAEIKKEIGVDDGGNLLVFGEGTAVTSDGEPIPGIRVDRHTNYSANPAPPPAATD